MRATTTEIESIKSAIRLIGRMSLAPMSIEDARDLRRMARDLAPKLPCLLEIERMLGEPEDYEMCISDDGLIHKRKKTKDGCPRWKKHCEEKRLKYAEILIDELNKKDGGE